MATANCFGFNYTISFTGTGLSTNIDSVVVKNISQNTTVTLSKGEILNLTDEITSIEKNYDSDSQISIYPHFEEGKSTLSFYSKHSGSSQIKVLNSIGICIATLNTNLEIGKNLFELKLPKGTFTILVIGNGFRFSKKMLQLTGYINQPQIIFITNESSGLNNSQKAKKTDITSMSYNIGDLIMYKGVSGDYSTIVTDIITGSTSVIFDFVECKDANGNHYPIVKIGSQIWMAENLKTTKYSDFSEIPNVLDHESWGALNSGAWCDYDNLASNGNKFGHLYNWFTVTDNRNIAPKGWRVPTQNDWRTLTQFLGESLAGRMLKESGTLNWVSPNYAADNTTGFSALPGGIRFPYIDVNFSGIGSQCNLWSTTQSNATSAYFTNFDTGAWGTTYLSYSKQDGMSVRCVLVK